MLCDKQITQQKKKNIYSKYVGLLKKTLKSVADPSSSLVCLKKCQISLKSLSLQISEPNTALSNVGGWRLHVQGRIMGLPNGYLPFFMQ